MRVWLVVLLEAVMARAKTGIQVRWCYGHFRARYAFFFFFFSSPVTLLFSPWPGRGSQCHLTGSVWQDSSDESPEELVRQVFPRISLSAGEKKISTQSAPPVKARAPHTAMDIAVRTELKLLQRLFSRGNRSRRANAITAGCRTTLLSVAARAGSVFRTSCVAKNWLAT